MGHAPDCLGNDGNGDDFNPCNHPASAAGSKAPSPNAKAMSARADGMVKPNQAATPPRSRARAMPTAILTWLLAGPGKNWQSATRSE